MLEVGFQLFRFNSIGRDFVSEPLPRAGFKLQIDAPPDYNTDQSKKRPDFHSSKPLPVRHRRTSTKE